MGVKRSTMIICCWTANIFCFHFRFIFCVALTIWNFYSFLFSASIFDVDNLRVFFPAPLIADIRSFFQFLDAPQSLPGLKTNAIYSFFLPGILMSPFPTLWGNDMQSAVYIDLKVWNRKVKVKVTQSCLTLCDPKDPARLFCPWNSLCQTTRAGSHSLSRGSSQPRDQTHDGSYPNKEWGWEGTAWL